MKVFDQGSVKVYSVHENGFCIMACCKSDEVSAFYSMEIH